MPLLCRTLGAYFLLLSASSMAQDTLIAKGAGFGIEVNAVAGKVYKHESKFTLPLPKVSDGTDINFVWNTYGRKDWEQRWRYPEIGIGFMYTHYGLTNIYGVGYGLYPNIGTTIAKGRQWEWTARVGDGIGYLTRKYSRQNPVDTINVAIGSHINDFFLLMTDLRYALNKHWDIQVGANFSHFSDASYNKPNLGINMYGAHIGIRYAPAVTRPKHILKVLPALRADWVFGIRGTMAVQSEYVSGGPHYPVYLGTAYVARRWAGWDKAFAGIDYSYHQSIYAYLRNNNLYPGQEAAHAYKSGIFLGNEFLFSRIGIICQFGYYLQPSAVPLGSFYEKIGGTMYLVKRDHGPVKEFYLCTFVKTQGFVAELGEFGLGIGF